MISLGLAVVLAAAASASPEIGTNITVYGYLGPHQFQFHVSDLLYRPLMVHYDNGVNATDDTGNKRSFTSYYLHYGLRSVGDYEAFRRLHDDLLDSDSLHGLVLLPAQDISEGPADYTSTAAVLQDGFTLSDLLSALQHPLPSLVVSRTNHFQGAFHLGLVSYSKDGVSSAEIRPRISYFYDTVI